MCKYEFSATVDCQNNQQNNYLFNRIVQVDVPGGIRTVREWDQNKVYAMRNLPNALPNNPYVKKETITTGLPSSPKARVVEYVYDANGRLRQRKERDWSDANGNPGVILRSTETVYYYPAPDASPNSDHANAYWNLENAVRLTNVIRGSVSNGAGMVYAVSEYIYNSLIPNGNKIIERRWDSVKAPSVPALGALTSSNSQELTWNYDAFGNLTDSYEPDVRTHVTYNNNGRVQSSIAGYDNSALQQTTTYTWLSNGMALSSVTNSGDSKVYQYDDVGRKIVENSVAVVAPVSKITRTYYDEYNKVLIKEDLKTVNDQLLQTIVHSDQMGRVILEQYSDGAALNVNDSNDGVKVKTIYQHFNGGSRVITSSPYRLTTDATLEWKCTQNDQAGRVTIVATFKGGSAPTNCASTTNRTGVTQISYNADWTTITDPAGKVRKERVDALGRLAEVIEDPGDLYYVTTYNYDLLDNLVKTTQGSQQRVFVYSSLGRLLSSKTPESGTTLFTYYDNGLVKRQTDARGKWSEATYDALHRITGRTYSDSTPDVTYEYYPNGTIQAGRLKSISSLAGTTTYTYNVIGNIMTSSQTIAGYAQTLDFSYEWYHASGAIKSITYPSGRKVEYELDDAGRSTKVSTTAKTYWDTTNVAQPYTADGRIKQAKLGNNLWETYDYATPGTSTVYRLGAMQGGDNIMRLEYNFSGTNNNGNVLSQKTSVAGGNDRTQTFTYDGVNRLASVNEAGGYAQTYGYDQWSNRWVSSSTGLYNADPKEPTSGTQFSELNNQFSGATYDASGNQLTYNGYTYEYDADGRNTVVKIGAVTQITNVYDGLGRRVKKVESGETTYYVYDAFDRLAVEYTTETLAASTTYPFTDMLGSVRAITSSAGALLECYDYTPFGRMLTASDTGRSAAGCYPSAPSVSGDNIDSGMSQKFIGQPHDDGTGLEYFGARFYSASLGRFTSPDPVLLTSRRMAQPHTLNLYVYANNNPLRFIDPTGLESSPIASFGEAASLCNPFADASRSCSFPVNNLAGDINFLELVHMYGWTAAEAFNLLYAIPTSNPSALYLETLRNSLGLYPEPKWSEAIYLRQFDEVVDAVSAYTGYSKEVVKEAIEVKNINGGNWNFVVNPDKAKVYPDFYKAINVDLRIYGYKSLHLHKEKGTPGTAGYEDAHFHVDTMSGGSFSWGNIFEWSANWITHGVVDVVLGQTFLSGGIYRW